MDRTRQSRVDRESVIGVSLLEMSGLAKLPEPD